MNEDKYNVRVHCNGANPFDIDLRGYGSFYVKPGNDYYFTNAPMSFINYLVQLKNLGITYEITNNNKGCLYETDLTFYRSADPRYVMAGLRKQMIKKEEKVEETREVVLSSTDGIDVEPVKVEDPRNVQPVLPQEPVEINALPTEQTGEEITQSEEPIEEVKEEEKIEEELPKYTDEQLQKFGKVKLLEIAHALGLESVSDINTKKEIREAILKAQE